MRSQKKKEHRADRRSREVYRYFQPSNPAALNSTWLHFGDESNSAASLSASTPAFATETSTSAKVTDRSSSRHSPNTTLTSFAQLAALGLNAERCVITILERDIQYILAEATRTIDIGDTSSFSSPGDGLWLGTSTVKKAWSLCQETIALESDKLSQKYATLTVNNLKDDARFDSLPFVRGSPNFRFYAGTPLTTENGVNIGCVFVLDPVPRPGISEVERRSLGTIASLVMDFLRVSRQASEGRRASRLSRGLRNYVEGSSTFVRNIQSSSDASLQRSSSSQSVGFRSRSNRSSSRSSTRFSRRSKNGEANLNEIIPDEKVPMTPPSDTSTNFSDDDERNSHIFSSDQNIKHGNQWAFQRAANLLRESLELKKGGGVVFLELGSNQSIQEKTGTFFSTETNKPAPLLAMSTEDEPFGVREGSYPVPDASEVDSTFLQHLAYRYPKGRLFSFHRDGTLTSSDEERMTGGSASETSESGPTNSRQQTKATETSMLNAFFPNASQIIFVPLWDAAASQWHSGCFCWNTRETAVFSPAVDLNAVLGFASSVMTEFNRLESLRADRRKGDFIGSISHELRSPLHGILAAAEFLEDTRPSAFQSSLIETISSCGQTLLDTMNQLLDFSKITSTDRKQKQLVRNAEDMSEQSAQDVSRLDPPVATDISRLLEEVVESVCRGHSFGKKSAAKIDQAMGVGVQPLPLSYFDKDPTENRENVQVIIDIKESDWVYMTQPGRLRRAVMNVFGNALKYTNHGQIIVRLEFDHQRFNFPRRQGLEDEIKLTISDTGKGISNTFLRENLFKPFIQEDPLAAGTGLGLSIVRSLMRNMKGRIGIESRLREGTTVTLSLPLARPVGKEEPFVTSNPSLISSDTDSPDVRRIRELYAHKSFAILDRETPGMSPDHVFWATIRGFMTNWFLMKLVPISSDKNVDFILVKNTGREMIADQLSPDHRGLVLAFCNDPADFRRNERELSGIIHRLAFVWLPCGPRKLARSILESLNSSSEDFKCYSGTQGGCLAEFAPALPSHTKSNLSQVMDSEASDGRGNIMHNRTGTSIANDTTSSEATEGITSDFAPSPTIEFTVPGIDNPQKHQCGPRILVVEDNEINLKLILTFLKKRDCDVLDAATNGKIAVDFAENNSNGYDIIFMDMSMPIMDGFEATSTIRSIEKEKRGGRAAFIVAFTGLSSFDDETKAYTAGVDMFLSKPVSFRDVARLLDDWEMKRQVT